MTILKAEAKGSLVVLDTPDASPSQTPVALSASEAFFLLASLQQSLEALLKPDIPLALRSVSFVGSPDFQVGITPSGDVGIRFGIGGLPAMEFRFDAAAVTKLRADLKRAALVPKGKGSKQ